MISLLKWFGFIVLAVVVLILGSCMGWFNSSATVRFRLTVEVDTPEGLKTGSGVLESTLIKRINGPPSHDDKVNGEAIEVDIGSRGSLFLLVSGMGSLPNELYRAFDKANLIDSKLGHSDELAQQIFISKWRKPVEAWPTWREHPAGWFPDRNNPESVHKFPLADLSDHVGGGFAVRRIEILPTSETISTGIEKRLPWLQRLLQRGPFTRLSGAPAGGISYSSDPAYKNLDVNHFKRSE
jgi:hypothetical protein